MATRFAVALLLIAATAAAAQNAEAKPPGDDVPYITSEAFTAAARAVVAHPPPLHVELGAVDLNTRLGRMHLLYLPFLAALPGAFGSRTWNQLPNAFELTGTEIAHRPMPPDPLAELGLK